MLLLTLQIADAKKTLAEVDTQEVLREGWSSRKRLLEKRKCNMKLPRMVAEGPKPRRGTFHEQA